MSTPEKFPSLNAVEAAERLGIREHTLRNWLSAGRGPAFYKIGGAVRFSAHDLEKFLAGCRVDRTVQR